MIAEKPKITFSRIRAIDVIRGIAIMIMIWVHFVMFFSSFLDFTNPVNSLIYGIMTHAGPYSAPFFYVVSGMSLAISTNRRREKNVPEKKIRSHIIKRGLLVILLGYGFSFLRVFWYMTPEKIINFLFFWDLLHSLGLMMILTYFCARMSIRKRMAILALVIGLTLLVMFTPFFFGVAQRLNVLNYLWEYKDYYFNKPLFSWMFLTQGNIGLFFIEFLMQIFWWGNYPIIPYLFFTVFGSIIGSLIIKCAEEGDFKLLTKYIFYLGFILLGLGFATYPIIQFPITNPWITPWQLDPIFYMLTSTGGLMLFFYLIFRLLDQLKLDSVTFTPAESVGRIPLTIYFLHGMLIGILLEGINLVFPIKNAFIWPIVLIPTVSIFLFFVVLSYGWRAKKYKYNFDWLLSKVN